MYIHLNFYLSKDLNDLCNFTINVFIFLPFKFNKIYNKIFFIYMGKKEKRLKIMCKCQESTNSQYIKAKRVKGVGIYYLSSRA